MAEAQVEQLVKMAHHIALNMGAEGEAAAGRTADHIRRFWTPAMRQLFIAHSREHTGELPPPLPQVAELLGDG